MGDDEPKRRQIATYLVSLAHRINDRLDVDAAWSRWDVEMIEEAADLLERPAVKRLE